MKDSISNFIERENLVKEIEAIEVVLTLSDYRGTIYSETYKGLEKYKEYLESMLIRFDLSMLPKNKK